MKKAFITLSMLSGIAAAVYIGHLLYSQQVSFITGSVLLLFDILAIIWASSLRRKHRPSGAAMGLFLAMVIILGTAVSAYADVSPLSSVKEKVVAILQGINEYKDIEGGSRREKSEDSPVIVEEYLVKKGMVERPVLINMRTVEYWTGKDAKRIKYKADKTPWVVNAAYEPTSSISTSFYMGVIKNEGRFETSMFSYSPRNSRLHTVLVEEKGDFIIDIRASGVEWWVKVGVER